MSIDFKRQQFFWSRTEKENGHPIWTGSKVPRGYGIMQINGDDVYAHRVAFCLANNLDLKDIGHLTIIRICERNDCVLDAHLIAKPKPRKKEK